jgi:hypothetical protein
MPNNEARAIDRNKAYPLSEFGRLAGLNKASLRSARRGGLAVRYVGNRPFVLGSDWLDWLATRPTTAPSAARSATAAD